MGEIDIVIMFCVISLFFSSSPECVKISFERVAFEHLTMAA